jgi:hypothetical protein
MMTLVTKRAVHFQRGKIASKSQPGKTAVLQMEKMASYDMFSSSV